jgi:hypothetical protein
MALEYRERISVSDDEDGRFVYNRAYHEGNDGMFDILSGARVQEHTTAK